MKKGRVGLYTCGPTVYDRQHIGNLRAYVFGDVLKRVLLFNAYKVNHVINITDVGHLTSDADSGEDKMIKALKREKLPMTKASMLKLAKKYTQEWQVDLQKLNVLDADVYSKATEHIPQMIAMVEKIKKNGFAYEKNSAVYFDVAKFKDYGKMARLKLESLEAGARVEVDSDKKDPHDFVLWFKAVGKHKNHLMQWDSPFSKGFPGWHIECSAMSTEYLGEQFDIHTGGIDHIPVHHTNEIAQTEAATGKKPWVKYWLHNDFIVVDKEKMSKSKGGFFVLSDLEEKGYDALAYRYLCLTAIYRKQLHFSMEAMDSAKASLDKLRDRVQLLLQNKGDGEGEASKYVEEFQVAINDDLNTPKALAVIWDMLKDANVSDVEKYETLLEFDRVLGLGLKEIKKTKVPKEVQSLLAEREHARLHKHWKEADAIRDKIQNLGYEINDGPDGAVVKKK